MLYNQEFETPEDAYTIPFGKANIVHEGDKITIAATSIMVLEAIKAAKDLAKQGIHAEVIDLRTIVPLDKATIIESVKKTGRLLIVDEGHESFGVSGEIAMSVMEDVFYSLDAPIVRLGTANVPLPFSPALEFPLIPGEKSIREAVLKVVNNEV